MSRVLCAGRHRRRSVHGSEVRQIVRLLCPDSSILRSLGGHIDVGLRRYLWWHAGGSGALDCSPCRSVLEGSALQDGGPDPPHRPDAQGPSGSEDRRSGVGKADRYPLCDSAEGGVRLGRENVRAVPTSVLQDLPAGLLQYSRPHRGVPCLGLGSLRLGSQHASHSARSTTRHEGRSVSSRRPGMCSSC